MPFRTFYFERKKVRGFSFWPKKIYKFSKNIENTPSIYSYSWPNGWTKLANFFKETHQDNIDSNYFEIFEIPRATSSISAKIVKKTMRG